MSADLADLPRLWTFSTPRLEMSSSEFKHHLGKKLVKLSSYVLRQNLLSVMLFKY
jgi:hypothetical protein